MIRVRSAIAVGASADSQKAKDIARSNKVSRTIDKPYETWNDIDGLSIAATASEIDDAEELATVGGVTLKKFPQIAEYLPKGGDIDPSEMAVFRIDTKVVSLLDYKRGFDHTEQVEV